jgi:NAD(P)-dependent dehydrogenase (short-subunit alcohol dehydrogenase family)
MTDTPALRMPDRQAESLQPAGETIASAARSVKDVEAADEAAPQRRWHGDSMGQVDGKVAIGTGAAGGIGAACARTLAREGAWVVGTDVDDGAGERLAVDICAAGGDATYLHQDVTDETRWLQVIAEVEGHYGRVDVVVANAGIAIRVPIVDMTLADWRRQQAVNLDGVFLSVKHSVPAMRRAGGGSIILMSSLAGLRGAVGLGGYCATKGGVRLFAKAAAMEHAEDNIRVNSVHPGIIDTDIWQKMAAGPDGLRRNEPVDIHALSRTFVPLGRAGEAADVAEGVLFLASSASGYMTGTELVIDGGMFGGGLRR